MSGSFGKIFGLLLASFACLAAVQEVALEVRVTSNGEPVTGLTASDFTVRENGKPQKIVAADFVEAPSRPGRPVEGQPVWVYVAVQVTPQEWPRVKEGIRKFIDEELRPELQISLAARRSPPIPANCRRFSRKGLTRPGCRACGRSATTR